MNKTLLLVKDDAGWGALYYTTTNVKEGSYVVVRDNGLSVQKVTAVITIEANSPYAKLLNESHRHKRNTANSGNSTGGKQ